MIEEWRDIEGYEGLYMVSSLGRVKSIGYDKERILKPGKIGYGYLQVCLFKDGKRKRYLVHRLVANAFIPNTENLPEVNHKDEDKTNNRVSNLEWMTSKDNTRYSQAIAANQYTLDGKFIRRWDCIKEIQYSLGFDNGYICGCCKGKYKSANGFKWFYSNDLRQPEPPLW